MNMVPSRASESASSSSDDEIIRTIKEIARAHLEWEGPLARDMPLVETMALDSLRLLTLVVEIEDRFRIRLEDGDEAGVQTVGDLVDTIRRKRADGAHAG